MLITGGTTDELLEAGGLLQVVAGVVVLGALDANTANTGAPLPAILVPADGGDRVHVSAQQRVVIPGLGNTLQL